METMELKDLNNELIHVSLLKKIGKDAFHMYF